MMANITAELIHLRGLDRILVKIPFKKACTTDFDFTGYNEESKDNSLNRVIEINAFNLWELENNGVEFSEEVSTLYKLVFGKRKTDIENVALNNGHKLKKYQLEGVRFMDQKRGRVLLTDEMGLGKTIQVIAYMMARKDKIKRTVVVCPAHIKLNWKDEFGMFWKDSHVEVIFGTKLYKIPANKRVLVLNQHLLKSWIMELCAFKPNLLVIDEAHSLVNRRTKTFGYIENLAENTKRIILLTGSPLVNSPKDLWSLVNMLNPLILGGYTRYIHHFCPEHEYHAMQTKFNRNAWARRLQPQKETTIPINMENRRVLHEVLVSTVMLRRLKKEVAKYLPKQIRKVIKIQIDNKTFWKAERELRAVIQEELAGRGRDGEIVDFKPYSRMRRLVGEQKFEYICEWIDLFLEESTEKLIVAGWHINLMEKLHKKYEKVSYLITGKVSTKKKHEIKVQFQSKDSAKRIIFGNLKSIGTGSTLTAASTMLTVELPYTGADLDQLEARIHRISQKAKSVLYVYFIIKDSLEERILEYISRKQKEAYDILDNNTKGRTIKDVADDSVDTDMLKTLLLEKQ